MAVEMELSKILIRERFQTHVIELRERFGDRVFPIEIGLFEAAAIERRLYNRKTNRPMTHELLASVIKELGGEIEQVLVNDLVHDEAGSGTFHARLHIRQNGELLNIDARPSDAIALGIATDVPIYVEDHVLDAVSG
ncbi:MAG: hypothetical protein CMJ18_17895 [Phycisphaeraceae bacterium]|nr:hypothetical protein [Phycisphaeraceae bacterium]